MMTGKELYNIASEMRKKSYAPYSKFTVGAALLCADGTIYTGCNIENKSYSLTVCAERTAFFKAISDGKRDFKAIAIAGGKAGEEDIFCSPCGACREIMSEFCEITFEIFLLDRLVFLGEILPYAFGSDNPTKY